jgi:hypothetical protein
MTASLVGGVLPRYQPQIGIPSVFLFVLAGFALGCALYSFTAAVFLKDLEKNRLPLLRQEILGGLQKGNALRTRWSNRNWDVLKFGR